jgi:drug/metabolite transporter (DMT)-like permease
MLTSAGILLIASIVLSSYLSLAFSYLGKTKADIFQVIVINYFVCVLTGSWVNGRMPQPAAVLGQEGWYGAVGMGIGFILVFNLMAITTQKISVAVSSVANKLSFIIPVVLSVLLFHETLRWLQWLGIAVALLAVIFVCYPKNSVHNNYRLTMGFLLPVILFIGSGLLDTWMNFIQHRFVNEQNRHDYLVTGFGIAGITGLLIATYGYIMGIRKWNLINLWGGIAIGFPNYFSIWCLVKFLSLAGEQSSVGIALNNMGIVLLSTVMAWVLFKQSLSKINMLGIFMALIAIGMITFIRK